MARSPSCSWVKEDIHRRGLRKDHAQVNCALENRKDVWMACLERDIAPGDRKGKATYVKITAPNLQHVWPLLCVFYTLGRYHTLSMLTRSASASTYTAAASERM